MDKEHQKVRQDSARVILSLLRLAITGKPLLNPLLKERTFDATGVDWAKVIELATEQGVLGLCFESLSSISSPEGKECPLDMDSLMDWLGLVEYQKTCYEEHKRAIAILADFFANCSSEEKLSPLNSQLSTKIQMMLLKGYGLSLYWPTPEHRPVGDIDVYFFGKWKKADQLVQDKLGIEIDRSHHHHTCYAYHDTMVENHYDFINVHAHSDARKIDEKLKELASSGSKKVKIGKEGKQSSSDNSKQSKLSEPSILLPSADFNALFLIRHLGQHFAGERVTLRQLLDWYFFLQKEGDMVNWTETNRFLKEIGLFDFKEHINHICEYCFQGTLDSLSEIEERILNDVLEPEFGENGKGVLFKWRRWKANIWKHKLVYKKDLFLMFCTLALSHIKKPQID